MSPIGRLAGLLRCSEGQAWTALLAAALALLTVLWGLPPALRDRVAVVAAPPSAAGAAPALDRPPPEPSSAPAPAEPAAPLPGREAEVALPPPAPPPEPFGPPTGAPPPPSPGPTTSAPPPTDLPPPPTSAPPPGAARVVAAGWAARDPAAPTAQGIPADGLPVGVAAGQEELRSLLRLQGTGPLRLQLVDDAGANVLEVLAVVRLCPLQGAFAAQPAQRLDRVPGFDAARCTSGTADQGAVTFPVPAAAPDGLALVADPAAAPAFRATFRRGAA